jgi:hypothetical protein
MAAKAGRKETEGQDLTVIRWRMRDGRCGKTARMSRSEAEALLRELAGRSRLLSFEVA